MPETKYNGGQRICLFGGTFDPIHSAHLRIAREAVERFSLKRVLFVPAGTPPHKAGTGMTSYEDRFRMVQLACKPYPEFEASRLEEGDALSYTLDTVKRFRPTMGPADRLYFLIGADAFDDIESWRSWRELVTLVEFIVVTRPGEAYRVPEGALVHPLTGMELSVSSSAIRSALGAGKSVPELPKEVLAYIETRGLYRCRERATIRRESEAEGIYQAD